MDDEIFKGNSRLESTEKSNCLKPKYINSCQNWDESRHI
jgi:hypothetical protein